MRKAIAALVVGCGLFVPATSPAQAAGPGGVSCNLNTWTIVPPVYLPGGTGTDIKGYTGVLNVASVTVSSRIVCTGSITGSGTVSGLTVSCPETEWLATGQCVGQPAPASPDESVWASAASMVNKTYLPLTITSDPTAPLTDTDGTQYLTCTFEAMGHNIQVVSLYFAKMACGANGFGGVVRFQSEYFTPPLADSFHTTGDFPDPPLCQNTQFPADPVPFVPGVGHANCIRALGNQWEAPLLSPSPIW